VGDTVRVIVIVTNERSEAITIEGNHCNQHFELRDGRGRMTGPAEAIGCLGVHIPVHLDPGERHTLTGFWSGRLGESQSSQPRYAAPGTYHIRGRVQLVSDSESVTGGHVPIEVRVAAGE
jgi:hypothetical protein